jgi:O-antigen/teichoic acid export membrane protein
MSKTRTPTLKQRALRAGGWTIAGHGLGQTIRLGSNLIMTRLLVPEMFGVMAIATTVAIVLNMLSDLGVRQSIVQSQRGDDPAFLDTAWVVQIVRGLLLWLLALMASVGLVVAKHYGIVPPQSVYAVSLLPAVIAVNSLSIIITGFQSTRIATANRRLDQKRIVQINLVSQSVGLAVMILVAVQERTIWALVAGGLVASLMTTVLSHLWFGGHRNRFRWEKEALVELMTFGRWVFLSSGLYVLAVNGDRLLLGAFVEAHVLGLYAIASLLITAVAGTFHRIFMAVSLPALSEVARISPERLRAVYNKLCLPGDVLLALMTGLLFIAGQWVIDLLYDPRYSASGGFLQVLALSLFAVRYEAARQLYLALGLPQYGTALSLARFIALYSTVPALYYVAGTNAAVWAIALHGLAAVPLVYWFNSRLRVNNWRGELWVLLALAAGLLCGLGVASLPA